MAYITQAGGEWLGYNYILANDVVLNDTEISWSEDGSLLTDPGTLNKWDPIDNFTGIFDGAGHTVSGLYVDQTGDGQAAGLFGQLKGDVRNLNIVNAYVTGSDYTGGLCGYYDKTGGYITNCTYSGAVVGKNSVGGITGGNNCTNFVNCVNYGEIWGSGDYVAGIVGNFYAYGIEECINKGNIHGGDNVGGIAGSSSIYGLTSCKNEGVIEGRNYVGGIIGRITNANLSSCGNTGNVTGTTYVGGLSGDTQYGSVTSWMSNIVDSYNSGNIAGEAYIGGITGYLNYSNISSCYTIGNVTGNDNTGALVGKSETVNGNGEITDSYYLLTGDNTTKVPGLGNWPNDIDDKVEGKDISFFCYNTDLPISQHILSETTLKEAT